MGTTSNTISGIVWGTIWAIGGGLGGDICKAEAREALQGRTTPEWEWEPVAADAKACREELGDCLQEALGPLGNDLRGRVKGRMPKGGLGRDLHGSARQNLGEDLQANV